MNRWSRTKRYLVLSSAVALWLNAPLVVLADNAAVTTDVVHVQGTWAEEEAGEVRRRYYIYPNGCI